MSDWFENAIFLSGLPKSGTTLLLNLMDGGEELITLPDEPSFPQMLRNRFGYKNSKHLLNDWLWGTPYALHPGVELIQLDCVPENFVHKKEFPIPADFEVPKEVEDKAVANTKLRGQENDHQTVDIPQYVKLLRGAHDDGKIVDEKSMIKESVSALMQASENDYSNVKFWAFKQPSLFPYDQRYFERFASSFPKGKIIVILRDPRGFYASLKLMKKVKGRKRIGFVRSLLDFVRDAIELQESYYGLYEQILPKFSKQVELIYYEDLVENPEKVMKSLSEVIGLQYSEIFTQPTKGGKPVSVVTSTHKEMDRKVSQKSSQRWKKDLSKLEIGVIDALCSKVMQKSPYQVVTSTFRMSLLRSMVYGLSIIDFVRCMAKGKQSVRRNSSLLGTPIQYSGE